ncbi:glucose-6-phosphate dehydrogenase [Staphylococcus pseudintermedius]|uniref:glucose-6-phosphate dehydrogenase n=1 Tax=Staphylococcus pseudintermedius TaxID=283734 RepID=UPI000BBCF5F7|nr:glucose-6-phosphate dehydrogenase [Staphylococcus pseudintermedius]EGQ3176299.1 glucose-6-phosphate dehydrogenase [Staphylococcus pseudintermedius]EHT7652701.1 glucose-6-phosphate dehydrogenase [Staphylococcus pseudintermedius]EIQ4013276.1 glucose-6-phosphate dehydrogenase [Staphylococcus pseudintermedius]EJD8481080.1 glucose-6-phosphate dehydrogenase [Staphylococcus pseudintermedius]MBU7227143.1 glucose-6-phosphate dehydrogenase [Staphylococcus pseudintermedius]
MNKTNNHVPALITIFGATGDLSHRKLFPSLFHLYQQDNLDERVAIIGIGRRELTNDDFRAQVKSSIQEHVQDTKHLDKFMQHVFYQPHDVSDEESYQNLLELSESLDREFSLEGNRVFYLAMAPRFFGVVTDFLKSSGLTNTKGFKRLVIEKPFGSDLKSAEELNEQIRRSFKEEEIFRIDHYLGKDMVQNIEVLRFSNAMFEPLWNNKYISNIQVTSSEVLGVEDRGGYYETSGALKDMVQNHMLQMVALLAMEPPISLNSDDIRAEKVKVLKSLHVLQPDEVRNQFVRGQYDQGFINGQEVKAYREEDKVATDSTTPTFVSGKVEIDNFRWAGVPFYIRTGKRMKRKSIQVVVEFKEVPMNLYYQKDKHLDSNLLVINIQPNEGVSIHLNGKKYVQGIETEPVQLSYAMSAQDKMNTVDAYENLLYDVLKGDATNFTHWEELKSTWKFVDSIQQAWDHFEPEFPNYESGTNGPLDSDLLLSRDGFKWWNDIQ